MMPIDRPLVSLALVLSFASPGDPIDDVDDAPTLDPSQAEVPLPAKAGWVGSPLLDDDVGVWTVGGVEAFPRFGCPEVFALDDAERSR